METVYTAEVPSPLGPLHLAAAKDALIGLWLHGQRFAGMGIPDDAEIIAAVPDAVPPLKEGAAWLDAYFAGRRPGIGGLPLELRGSAFRQLIWKMLTGIPYGQVVTYGELAAEAACRMGKKRMAAQAVGGAVGHNPVAIIVPCHRVVGAQGNLTGYGGGMSNKTWLLAHEGVDPAAYRLSH